MKNQTHITQEMLTARIEELRESLTSREFGGENFDASIAGGAAIESERAEFEALVSFEAECERYCSDWQYEDAVMSEAATRDYIRSIIDDCYEIPATLTSGQWPYRHITIDYEAAIDEAMGDYTAIELDGHTFYCR